MEHLIDQVRLVAEEAGRAIMEFYRHPIQVTQKQDDSPLTQADLASHRLISRHLGRLTPEWPVLSEESPGMAFSDREGWGRFWVVDPLDGTKEFIKRTGEFTVNIALVVDRTPAMGVVYAPALDLSYWATREDGAFKQMAGKSPEGIRVRPADPARLSLVASRDHAGPMVRELMGRFPGAETQSLGSSLKFCLVAEGKADVYLRDVPTCEWDTAAAQCIVEQAGGVVLDLAGRPLRYNKPVLTNPAIVTLGDPGFRWRS